MSKASGWGRGRGNWAVGEMKDHRKLCETRALTWERLGNAERLSCKSRSQVH